MLVAARKPPIRAGVHPPSPSTTAAATEDWAALGLAPPAPAPRIRLVDEVVASYLVSAEFGALTPHTRRKNARNCAMLCAVYGRMRLADLSAPSVAHWLTAAPTATVRRDWRAIVSVVWRHGVRCGAAAGDAPAVPWPEANPPRSRYVTDDELARFLRPANDRLRAYVALKLATGLRRGQLWRLSWADWDEPRGVLLAAASKGGYATRYTGPSVRGAVRAVRGAFGAGAGGMAMICRLKGGRFADPKHMCRVEWDRARAAWLRSGGAPFTEHDLRAKVATDAADVTRAQQLLGHTSPRVTEAVYRRLGRTVEGHEALSNATTLAAGVDLPVEHCQLDLFAATPATPAPPPEAQRHPLVDEYLDGAGVAALARRHGVAKATVIRRLRLAGVALRGRRRPALAVQTMVERYEDGDTAALIARDAGCSANTVRQRLRAAGVEIRGRGRYERVAA